jgi:hypothetical protein
LGVVEDPGSPFRTALGYQALGSSYGIGEYNTAMGYNAFTVPGGSYNTVIGALAASLGGYGFGMNPVALDGRIGAGDYNTGVGAKVFFLYSPGQFNTATGYEAAYHGGAAYNTAYGARALYSNDEGDGNTAVGYAALEQVSAGLVDCQSFNTAIGYRAGSLAGGYSESGYYNIFIGANQKGISSDGHTIRIGLPYNTPIEGENYSGPHGQNRTFIAGIVESPLSAGDGPAVVGITDEGQLGTISNDLLPQGPPGPQGIQGPAGPAGEGLLPGSLIFLPSGFNPPSGYTVLGSYDLSLTVSGVKKPTKLTVYVYQKQ